MKKCTIDNYVSVVSHYESAAIAQPRKCAFDFVSSLVAAEFAAILRAFLLAIGTMRADKFYTLLSKTFSQWIRIVASIGNETLGFAFGSTRSATRHSYCFECLFDEFDFRRGRRVQVVSQRNTLAVDHHHPLRSLASFGLSDAFAPFLADAKLPSIKHSLQSSWPRSSSSDKNARQASSHISRSSQSRNRRQQVEPLAYFLGTSSHGAPVRNTQSIPSNTLRLSIHGLPPRFDFLSFGSNCSIFTHCSSVSFQRFLDRFLAIDRPLSTIIYTPIVDGASIKYKNFRL
jgi:hypothetical protein